MFGDYVDKIKGLIDTEEETKVIMKMKPISVLDAMQDTEIKYFKTRETSGDVFIVFDFKYRFVDTYNRRSWDCEKYVELWDETGLVHSFHDTPFSVSCNCMGGSGSDCMWGIVCFLINFGVFKAINKYYERESGFLDRVLVKRGYIEK